MTRLSSSLSMARTRSVASSAGKSPSVSASAARTRQCRSGSMPARTAMKASRSIAAAARNAAARSSGQSSVHRSWTVGRPSIDFIAPSAIDDFHSHIGMRVGDANQGCDRCHGLRCADLCERTDAGHRQLEARLRRRVDECEQRLHRRHVLQRAEAARREARGCIGPWTAAAAAGLAPNADPRRAAARRRQATTATPAGRRASPPQPAARRPSGGPARRVPA